MTTTHPLPTSTSTSGLAPIGAASALVASLGTAWGAHTVGEVAVCVGLVVATAAAVFGFLIPRAVRAQRGGRTALALALAAAVLMLPAFWAGVPFVLAVGAVVAGSAGRRSHHGATAAIAGLVVGALAALAYLAIYASEISRGIGGFDYL